MSIIQMEQTAKAEREISLTDNNRSDAIFLNHEEIVELLPLFKEECVYMHEAYLENGVLHCSFNTFDYPFSKKSTKHFTRTHALLFVTQASYLMTAILKRQNSQWPLDMAKAVLLALEEQMTFTSIQLNFRHFIQNKDGIELNLVFRKWRILKDRIYLEIEFKFPEGCYGQCRALIAIDRSLKIERWTKE